MRVVVSFRILGKHKSESTFPIFVGSKEFYLGVSKLGFIDEVSVAFTGASPSEGIVWSAGSANQVPQLAIGGKFALEAERDVRAWQSVMAPYALIDIDYDDVRIETAKEKGDEEIAGALNSFKYSKQEREVWGQEEFSVFGRAFLAAPLVYEEIEPMSFFIDGRRALGKERYVDAYNLFYLFF